MDIARNLPQLLKNSLERLNMTQQSQSLSWTALNTDRSVKILMSKVIQPFSGSKMERKLINIADLDQLTTWRLTLNKEHRLPVVKRSQLKKSLKLRKMVKVLQFFNSQLKHSHKLSRTVSLLSNGLLHGVRKFSLSTNYHYLMPSIILFKADIASDLHQRGNN